MHAYVLMTTHVNLLLTPDKADNASLLLKQLGQRYVQYINRSYCRSGTLREGRFRSSVAREEDYVLACYRYIEVNQARAEMVKHPRYYRWSSYRINAEGQASNVITQHEQYRALGRSEEARREAYRVLVQNRAEVLRDTRAATNGNYALGSRRFQAEISALAGRRVTRAGRPPKDPPVPEGKVSSTRR